MLSLGYLAQFNSLTELWAAHADGRPKFQGVGDRMNAVEELRLEAESISLAHQ